MQLSDMKETLSPFNEYTEYISRDSPSIHMAARMFEELCSILFAIKERRGEWQKVLPAVTVPVSDGISLLEQYHDCVKVNDIHYIASILDPQIRTKWLKTWREGYRPHQGVSEESISHPKQPVSTAPIINHKSFNYRFLGAFSLQSLTSLSLVSTGISILLQSALDLK
jgi:hypothetical protein